MSRIEGSPHNGNAYHSNDITEELILSFPSAAKKVATQMTG